MVFRRKLSLIALFVAAVMIVSSMAACPAFASDLLASEIEMGQSDASMEAQASELSSEYALLKSDGWLYRADSDGNALSNGTLWYGPSVLFEVKTLFIDADVTSCRDEGKVCKSAMMCYTSGGKTYQEAIWISGSAYETKKLSELDTIIFKLDASGENACSDVGFSYSSVKTVVNFEKTRVRNLKSDSFSFCPNLKTIDLSSVTETGSGAFYDCESLESVDMPNVQTIGFQTFNGCSALRSVKFKRCISIDQWAFEHCSSLSDVDLGDCLTSMNANAFQYCSSLEKLDMPATLSGLEGIPWFGTTFDGSPIKELILRSSKFFEVAGTVELSSGNDVVIFVPASLYADYTKNEASHNCWYDYRNNIVAMPDLSDAQVTLSQTSYTYDGFAKTPTPSVTISGTTLEPGVDYSVSYKDNVNAGTAFVTVCGKGKYAGGKSATFEIKAASGNGSGGNSPSDSNSESGKSDLSSYVGSARAAGFTDLASGAWYMSTATGAFASSKTLYLDYTIKCGLMSGYAGSTLFGPDDTLSRGMAATIIYRMATGKTAGNTDNNVTTKFSDVPKGAYYAAAVKWCSESGVVTGYNDVNGKPTGKFGPDDKVTREQLTAMIARYCTGKAGMKSAGSDVSRFKDAGKIAEWAKEGVAFCAANAIVSGIGDTGNFQPQGNATRCQMSKIIAVTARMLE